MKTFLELSRRGDRIHSRESCWNVNSLCVWQVSGLETLKSQGGGFQPWEKVWKGSSPVTPGPCGLSSLKEGATHDVHSPAPQRAAPAVSPLGHCDSGFGALWSPPLGSFVGQQCREPLKGDLANLGGTVQSNNHIFNSFLATSLHFCRAALLKGLVAAVGHHGGHSDPFPALGMWIHLGNKGQLAIREPGALMRNCEAFQTTLIPTNL